MSSRFYELYYHEPNNSELQSSIRVYEFEPITKNGGMCVVMIFFLSRVSWDQRFSDTPQSMTKKMDIRGLHSTEGRCYLQ